MPSNLKTSGSRINYPTGPCPPACGSKFDMSPGQGINANPLESAKILNVTLPYGKASDILIGLNFQLGKWGYKTVKVSESLEVSPYFTEEYNKIIREKARINDEIKNGFMSVSKAVEDYELLSHDLRKYTEYMNYFKEWHEAKEAKDEEKIKNTMHTMRSLFIDKVDVHTGDGIALKSIAPRWSTIISDFLTLSDDDDSADKIQKKLNITKAEAVILTTKNKLFVQWRDQLFYPTVKDRYERLSGLLQSRLRSIDEYRNSLFPLISRHRAIKDMRESDGGRRAFNQMSWYHQGSMGVLYEEYTIWAWKSYTVEDFYKPTYEMTDKISLKKAGFNENEIKQIGKKEIKTMPAIPIMDDHIRFMIDQINTTYQAKVSAKDVFDICSDIQNKFSHGGPGPSTAIEKSWYFSPYYIFLEIPVRRTVVRLTNGTLIEDLFIENMTAQNCSQNIIIGIELELMAMHREMENEIAMYIGTKVSPDKTLEESLKESYPDAYSNEKKSDKKQKKKETKEDIEKIRNNFNKTLNNFGIKTQIFYSGPYEKFMKQRMAKMMQRAPVPWLFPWPHPGHRHRDGAAEVSARVRAAARWIPLCAFQRCCRFR